MPVGTSIRDNNPAFIEAIIAYRAGVYDKFDRDTKPEGDRSFGGTLEDESLDHINRLKAEGKTVAKPTGRRRKRR